MIACGGKTFATANFRERLSDQSQFFAWIDIHIDQAAAGTIYVGDHNVSSVAASRAGAPLSVTSSRGDVIRLTNVDLFEVWGSPTSAGDRLHWLGQ